MTDPIVQWITPAPIWPALAVAEQAARRATFRRPAILRFTSDLFMDEFMATLAADPARLGAYEARPETWREPAPLPDLVAMTPGIARPLSRLRLTAAQKASNIIKSLPDLSSTRPLKLYQPAHQRHYLVTACLVCRIPGLPDRVLDLPNQERASFVIRRLFAAKDSEGRPVDVEYAMVTTARGSQWVQALDPLTVGEEEERQPLFGVHYVEDDGHRRRLLAGTVPVGRREHYIGAPPRNVPAAPAGAALPSDSREGLLIMQVIAPWNQLIDQANLTQRTLVSAGAPKNAAETVQRDELIKAAREQAQTSSWYVLTDLAEFLETYLPNVWKALNGDTTVQLDQVEQEVLDELANIAIPAGPLATELLANSTIRDVKSSLAEALKAAGVKEVRDGLDDVTLAYDRARSPADAQWPNFLFPLADHTKPFLLKPNGSAHSENRAVELQRLIVAAFPPATKPAPPLPLAAQPVLDVGRAGRFVIRCVFERPHCGPLLPPVVSEPSAEFQLAGFFDTDAPARPIRIALPIDTTTGGLRKFDKNTAFMISDVLACQIERARGITFGDLVLSVLPWPFHKDLPNPGGGACQTTGAASMGMICTLSIPIITICALILLIIIVTLLDIIFKWIPFFIACFPLPGFKAKQ